MSLLCFLLAKQDRVEYLEALQTKADRDSVRWYNFVMNELTKFPNGF